MENIDILLTQEIERRIPELEPLDEGSEEMDKAIKHIAVLHGLVNEREKMYLEQRKLDIEEKKLKDDSEMVKANDRCALKWRIIDTGIKVGIAVIEITVPLFVATRMYNKGMRFEETGTWTEKTPQMVNIFQGIANKFKRTK